MRSIQGMDDFLPYFHPIDVILYDILLMICDLNGNSYFSIYLTMCFIIYVNVILMHTYMEPIMVRYESNLENV
jgi:hypothetical protein